MLTSIHFKLEFYHFQLVKQLFGIASEVEGPDRSVAEIVLAGLAPTSGQSPAATPDSSHPDLTSIKRTGGVKRHPLTVSPQAETAQLSPAGPYPRDRSSSAPNINAINDEATVQHNVTNFFVFLFQNLYFFSSNVFLMHWKLNGWKKSQKTKRDHYFQRKHVGRIAIVVDIFCQVRTRTSR